MELLYLQAMTALLLCALRNVHHFYTILLDYDKFCNLMADVSIDILSKINIHI